MRSTGDPTFDLIAATFRQALADAKRGDSEAAAWLDMCCPGWRKMDKRKARKAYPLGARARYKKSAQTVCKGETCSNLSESPNLLPRSRQSGAPTATSGAPQP
jgi:hypothetical protein